MSADALEFARTRNDAGLVSEMERIDAYVTCLRDNQALVEMRKTAPQYVRAYDLAEGKTDQVCGCFDQLVQ